MIVCEFFRYGRHDWRTAIPCAWLEWLIASLTKSDISYLGGVYEYDDWKSVDDE